MLSWNLLGKTESYKDILPSCAFFAWTEEEPLLDCQNTDA